MSKTFRPWDIEQRWLLPPSVHELVPVVSLIQLVGAMGSALDARQRHKVADEMRDMADRLELREFVQ